MVWGIITGRTCKKGRDMDIKSKLKVGALRLKGFGVQEVVDVTRFSRQQVASVFRQAAAEEQFSEGYTKKQSKPFDFYAVRDKLNQLEKAVYAAGIIDIFGGQTAAEREQLVPELRAIERRVASLTTAELKQFEPWHSSLKVVCLRSRALMAIKQALLRRPAVVKVDETTKRLVRA